MSESKKYNLKTAVSYYIYHFILLFIVLVIPFLILFVCFDKFSALEKAMFVVPILIVIVGVGLKMRKHQAILSDRELTLNYGLICNRCVDCQYIYSIKKVSFSEAYACCRSQKGGFGVELFGKELFAIETQNHKFCILRSDDEELYRELEKRILSTKNTGSL